jgi:hypothetical protein
MPRSGSTLQFQLTAHLVEWAGLGERVEWVRPEEFPRLRSKYSGRAGWKVFKSHACTREIRAEFDLHNAKGVYVYRDVRDVVVSRMRKRDQTFNVLWQGGGLDNLLSGFDRWTSIHGVLVSRYEDMVVQPAGEVDRIARHLGIRIRRDECENVASQYTVAQQFQRIREAEAAGRLEDRDGFRYDPKSNLHVNHIRSGKSGEWRHVLTHTQVALIEERAKRWLLANGYALSLPNWQRVLLSLGRCR